MFDEECPSYIAMGLPYEDYWYGDPYKAYFIRKGYEVQRKQENYNMWLQGAYVFKSIMIAISNIHLDGKPHAPNPYLEKPFDLYGTTKIEEQKQAEQDKQKVIDILNKWKTRFDSIPRNGV